MKCVKYANKRSPSLYLTQVSCSIFDKLYVKYIIETDNIKVMASNMVDTDDWRPPTDAEQKVYRARRERQDKISKLIGDYLLKGYKMLATTCPQCDTIMLRDKQGMDFCTSCRDLTSDVDKDNPVVSHTAAASQVREQEQHLESRRHGPSAGEDEDDGDLADFQGPYRNSQTAHNHLPTEVPGASRPTADLAGVKSAAERILSRLDEQVLSAADSNPHKRTRLLDLSDMGCVERSDAKASRANIVSETRDVIEKKLVWANKQLSSATEADYILKLCQIIDSLLGLLSKIDNAFRYAPV